MSPQYFADTARKYDQISEIKRASISMPSRFLGGAGQGYRSFTKTVRVRGTVETLWPDFTIRDRVRYGWTTHAHKQYLVLEHAGSWHVIEEKAQ